MSSNEGLSLALEDYTSKFALKNEFRGGDAEQFSARIDSITVQDGEPIKLVSPGVVLLVGGNNAGKSTLLRQMHARITAGWAEAGGDAQPRLLNHQDLVVTGTAADAFAWLASNSHLGGDYFQRNAVVVHPSVVEAVWGTSLAKGQLDAFGRAITLAPNARTRFNATLPGTRRPDIAEPPASELHYFEDDPELMAELDRYAQDIFGTGLTLDPLSGQLVIRFGKVAVNAPPVDKVTPEYRKAISNLKTLENQGDGVGSTLGLLIPLLAGRNPIAFVDEPEAYLHPPQAFKLGQAVAAIAKRHRSQIVVATHDRNFVAGVLSAKDVSQTVLRLERTEDTARAFRVEPDSLRDIWSSAILRHSNVLDGLFHRAVVVAENERDCVFYAAALESSVSLPGGLLPSDVLFVSSHGKDGIAEVASILVSAHVPVVAAIDLDVVRDKDALKKTLTSLGGDWDSNLDRDFDSATAEFRVARKPLMNDQILRVVTAVLSGDPKEVYDSDTKKAVSRALSIDNPWDAVKKHGMSAFLANRQAADRLARGLAEQGIVVVPVGELERFAPSLGVSKGKNWLPAALGAGAHNEPEAQSFAGSIAAAIISLEARATL